MFREPKRSTSKQNLSVKATCYPVSRIESRPLALKEGKQLFLLQGQDESLASSGEVPLIPSRYHQNGAAEKVLGAVYTPPRVAAALTRWAVRAPTDKVLDPSCGEGVFLSAARTRLADLGARKPECVGVDIDPETAAATGAVCEDFFSWARSAQKFDIVVGNPPFIRSHLFPEASRTVAFSEMVRMGLRPSRLMSTWAPFLAVCCRVLTETGRLAMVIPEELLHVGYAEGLRKFLLRRFRRVFVRLPSHEIFSGVQQAVVLLLCENENSAQSGLLSIEYSASARLAASQQLGRVEVGVVTGDIG